MTTAQISAPSSSFEIRFATLSKEGRGLVRPFDDEGDVDIDALSERSRNNCFFARTMSGREQKSA